MDPSALTNVDLNLLKALDALLRERSVTRAAARLMVTQPSMSGSLARLRELFGDELLVRAGREMQPTLLAERLEGTVHEILERIEETVLTRDVFDPARDRRTFTVLATDYPVLVLLHPLIRRLRAVAPRIGIHVATARPDELHSHRALEGSDLAIVPAAIAEGASLPSQVIFTDRFVGAAWRRNREVGDALSFDNLDRLPYLGFRQAGRAAMPDRYLEDIGRGVQPATVVESFVVGAHLLEGTAQVAFLQERLVERLRARAQLRALRPPVEFPSVREAMVWPRHADGDPAHRWLREQIADVAQTA